VSGGLGRGEGSNRADKRFSKKGKTFKMMDEHAVCVCVYGGVRACKHEMRKKTNISRLITVKKRERQKRPSMHILLMCSQLADFLMYAGNTTLKNSITGFKELDCFNWFSKCPVSEMNRSAF